MDRFIIRCGDKFIVKWVIDWQEARGAEVQRAVLDLRPRLWRGEEKRKLLKEVQVASFSYRG